MEDSLAVWVRRIAWARIAPLFWENSTVYTIMHADEAAVVIAGLMDDPKAGLHQFAARGLGAQMTAVWQVPLGGDVPRIRILLPSTIEGSLNDAGCQIN